MNSYVYSGSTIQTISPIDGGQMMPLSFFREGETGNIVRISGKEDIRKHLEGLGFVNGTEVGIVSSNGTGYILDVKGSRIAIDNRMASKIICTKKRVII